MDIDAPAPLSPADCDLRGYEFMPLFGNRLFSSIFDARATDAEFRSAMKLWWSAWQECPAGSLPNDDAALCKAAGLGRDLRAWLKVKVMALHGFIECNDGRLYHRLISEQAKEAFARRLKERERKAKMRAAKAAGHSEVSPKDVPRDTTRTDRGQAVGQVAEVPSDRTGEDRRGQDKEESKQKAPSPFAGLEHVIPCEQTGRATVSGWYLDRTQERVFEAARIDDARWTGNIKPLIAWLADGIEPDTIVSAITRRVDQGKYSVPHSLAYFDKPVREAHGKARP